MLQKAETSWYTVFMAYHDPEFEEQLIGAQDVFVWEAPEYERYHRGPRWYLFMSLVVFFLVFYSIWTANYLFALIILLTGIIFIIAGNEKPRTVLIQVGESGIVIDGEYLGFEDIRHFGIVFQPPNVKVLYIYPRPFMRNRMRIYLGEQDPVELRNHLKQYIVEDLDLRDEHASDILAKLLKL